jgi:prophage regulatory protein
LPVNCRPPSADNARYRNVTLSHDNIREKDMSQPRTQTTDRIISAAERRQLLPFSDMHIWRLEKAGKFPKRIKLGAHRVGWSYQEIAAWIEARKSQRQG